jgi:serine/threonine protein kinase
MEVPKSTNLKMYDIRNHYKVVDKVGKGTYGTVFKVLNLQDNKHYAIKKF